MYTVLCGNGDNNGSVWSFQKVFYYPLYYRIKQEFLSEGFPLVEKAYQLLVLITYKLGYLFDNVRVFLSDYVYKMYVFWSFSCDMVTPCPSDDLDNLHKVLLYTPIRY